jgi:hypothetical protein
VRLRPTRQRRVCADDQLVASGLSCVAYDKDDLMRALAKTIGMMALVAACATEPASTYQVPQATVAPSQSLAPSLPPPSEADIRWIYIRSDLRWDAATVKRTGNIVTLWFEATITEGTRRALRPTLGNEVTRIVYGRTHTSINCNDRKYFTLSFTVLDSQGAIVSSSNFRQSDGTWDSIPPETRIEALMKSVCPR